MLISYEKAQDAFRKVKHLREEYRNYSLAPNLSRLSVEDLFAIVRQMYQIDIVKRGVPFEARHTRGMLLRFRQEARIYVRHDLDDDMKRFTAVKELCHVILDEEEDWSVDGVNTIEQLQNDLHLNGNNTKAKVAASTSQAELLAELAALELLYPIECRQADQRRQNFVTQRAAYEHGIPVSMVERAISENYREAADRLWEDVGLPDFLKME